MRTVFATLLLLCLALSSFAGQTLVFSLPESEPVYVGFAVLKEAYQRIGIQAKYRRMPAHRCLEASNAGITDGETDRTATIEKEYPNLVRVPTPVQFVENMAVTCRGAPPVTGLESIRHKRIGIMEGFKIPMEATEGFPYVHMAKSWDKLFNLLDLGRLDVVIAPRQVVEHQKEKLNRKCLEIREPVISTPLYHYLHKKHAHLIPRVDAALRDIMNNNEDSDIRNKAKTIEKYDWQSGTPDSEIRD